MITLIHGDCLEILGGYQDHLFDATCFSPPYGMGTKNGFDCRQDMRPGGRFIPYALEIARVSRLWAVNLTQLVDNGRLSLFIEELVMTLAAEGVELFDRWVTTLPGPPPTLGLRIRVGLSRPRGGGSFDRVAAVPPGRPADSGPDRYQD